MVKSLPVLGLRGLPWHSREPSPETVPTASALSPTPPPASPPLGSSASLLSSLSDPLQHLLRLFTSYPTPSFPDLPGPLRLPALSSPWTPVSGATCSSEKAFGASALATKAGLVGRGRDGAGRGEGRCWNSELGLIPSFTNWRVWSAPKCQSPCRQHVLRPHEVSDNDQGFLF